MNFLYLSLIAWGAQALPGPDFALVTRASIRYGTAYGVACSMGIATALLVHCIIICLGVVYILNECPMITNVVLGAAVLWLLYLAWQSWPKKGVVASDGDEEVELPARRKLFIQGFITNILNAKCILFLFSISTPILAKSEGWFAPLMFTGIIVGQGAIGWAGWSYALRFGPVNKILQRHTQAIERIFSILLTIFAVIISYEIISSLRGV